MPSFKVAIQCLCYNHAPFVKRTLDGLSSQKTEFKYIAVVIDDASTDGTQDVIKQYLNQYFYVSNDISKSQWETEDAFFFHLRHKENTNFELVFISLKYNFNQQKKSKSPIMAEWIGNAKYWAFCECDDYWIYDRKIQEQVDFLDSNDDYGLVYSDFDIENYDTGEYINAALKNGVKPIIHSFEEHLLKAAYIAPMSWMCRIPLNELMNNYQGPPTIDTSFIMALELFLRSKVFFWNKVTCVYGRHSGSATKQETLASRYHYAHGVYATQKYYLDKYNLREKYPNCLDYFLNAYYCYIISNKIKEEYDEVRLFFHRNRDTSFKFRLFENMMKSQWMFPILQAMCKQRIKNN